MRSLLLTLFALVLIPAARVGVCQEKAPAASDKAEEKLTRQQKQRLYAVVNNAFAATHDGWSSDEVILRDDLNVAFLKACAKELPETKPVDFNWTLMNLRKASKLETKATKRARTKQDADYLHAGEIAARTMEDKHAVSTDRMLADPKLRAEFDKIAQKVAPGVDAYLLRKAAIRLRKARKLKPELVVRISDWGREVTTHPAKKLVDDEKLIPTNPGIYIFRDKTGYLYIGESYNLRERVSKHLDHSDRKSLAKYLWSEGNDGITVELHAFDPKSKAKTTSVRRAYESELIRSRKPRFNIRP